MVFCDYGVLDTKTGEVYEFVEFINKFDKSDISRNDISVSLKSTFTYLINGKPETVNSNVSIAFHEVKPIGGSFELEFFEFAEGPIVDGYVTLVQEKRSCTMAPRVKYVHS